MARGIKSFVSLSVEECLSAVKGIYEQEGKRRNTDRHYYYMLLGCKAVKITNAEKSAKNAYAYVCKLLVKAREDGIIPWGAIIDPGRRYTSFGSSDLREYAKLRMGSAIMLDFWRGQPRRVEIWVEKDTMREIVTDIVWEYRIPVQINRGYASSTVIHEAAERYGNGKGWTLLYIGDFDPSGLDIDRALRDGLRKKGSRPNIVRVALNWEDTVSLIPREGLDLKEDDSRLKQFVALYGKEQQGYEIDSLPSTILEEKILSALDQHMDIAAFKKVIELEDVVDDLITMRLDGTLNRLVDALLEEGVPGSSLPLQEQRRYLLPKEEFEEED